MGAFIIDHKDGAVIYIRASTNGNSDSILGIETRSNGKSYLKIKTSAIAENGHANDAIMKLLAKRLDIPKSLISILSGHTSREKSLLVNAPKDYIEARLKNS